MDKICSCIKHIVICRYYEYTLIYVIIHVHITPCTCIHNVLLGKSPLDFSGGGETLNLLSSSRALLVDGVSATFLAQQQFYS